jgi:ADP-ribose pyrophosphatase YjhB (NUDIX family)
MKTIVRVSEVIEGGDALREAGLSPFAVRTLANGFGKTQHDAVLVVDPDGPTYLLFSRRPPELVTADRQVFGVFCPDEMQDPVATFCDEADAKDWATRFQAGTYRIEAVDAIERDAVKVSVTVMVRRGGDILLCRRAADKHWAMPESALRVGEAADSAGRRAVESLTGLSLGEVKIPARVPYVNTYLGRVGAHFLTLCLVGEYIGGDPEPQTDLIDRCQWFSAEQPPQQITPMIQGMLAILSVSG